jgi:hypothetical protein
MRQNTFYTLISLGTVQHFEETADSLTDSPELLNSWIEKKSIHLLKSDNNEAFIDWISNQNDLLVLDRILGEQLKLYARKKGEGFEENKGGFYSTYKARKDWLNHTIFICKDEYNRTKREIFNEVVLWCEDWKTEWLETFNPYSPDEREEMHKDLKTPLWKELDEGHLQENTALKEPEKLFAKHYALAYIFDSYSSGTTIPVGDKKEIERIGNTIMGVGRGNSFYKNFNKLINQDLNSEQILLDFIGLNWREALLFLSKNPNEVKDYLQSKGL